MARIAPRGSGKPFKAVIFTDDDNLFNLIHLLLVNNKALLMQAIPTWWRPRGARSCAP